MKMKSIIAVAAIWITLFAETSFALIILSQKVRILVTSAAPLGTQDFQTRCNAAGVVKCVGFDDATDFNIGSGGTNGAYGANSGIVPPSGTSDFSRATRDTSVKASGGSSLKFSIPPNSSADASGSYFTNFSQDLSLQFDGGSDFFIQWRQKFDQAMLNQFLALNGDFSGFKQIIIGTGDKSGCTISNNANGQCQSSCSSLETVATNLYSAGFPRMYNSCTGSASHGPYDGFYEPFGAYDFKLQNAMPAPYCLYSQKDTSHFAPVGNCFGYRANEWMTFQIEIQTGPRIGDEFVGSHIRLWMAHEAMASQLVINWGPYNLSAGKPADLERYGKLWLTPYMTGKDPSKTYPQANTWYDELIISKSKIADPK